MERINPSLVQEVDHRKKSPRIKLLLAIQKILLSKVWSSFDESILPKMSYDPLLNRVCEILLIKSFILPSKIVEGGKGRVCFPLFLRRRVTLVVRGFEEGFFLVQDHDIPFSINLTGLEKHVIVHIFDAHNKLK